MREAMGENGCEPLLKWAGGKRRLLPHIKPILPHTFGRYFEPFVGGGAVFFALSPGKATLSDINSDLITTYMAVRDDVASVMRRLAQLRNTSAEYYKVRRAEPRSAAGCAARMIYLCTLSFNGIYRQNRDGVFNVPYGRKKHLNPHDATKLYAISRRLQGCDLLVDDFENAVRTARRGDLVYFDPPYTVAHGNNGFIKYNAKLFSWDDQRRLAEVATTLKRIGVHVVVSNAFHPSVHKLYAGFRSKTIERHSVMAAASVHRRPVQECLFY